MFITRERDLLRTDNAIKGVIRRNHIIVTHWREIDRSLRWRPRLPWFFAAAPRRSACLWLWTETVGSGLR